VKFVPRTEIGTDIAFEELNKFAATFLAVGAHKSKRMGIPGEDISGVLPGLSFLKDVNFGKRPKLRGKVAVIGGGNTAIDVARCVLRLGGKPLILYRRSYEEMPAIREEIHEAEHEGIEIQFLIAPLEIRKRGRMLSLTTQKMKLGGKDSSGRRRPVPVKDSEVTTPYSMVLTAIGEDPGIGFLPEDVCHESWGIQTDEAQRTSMDEIFAGGDAGVDKRAVTDAIGAGRRAATAISQYLAGRQVAIAEVDSSVTHINDLRLDYFATSHTVNKKKISDSVRVKSFREVNLGLSERDTENEANRCFSCGVCNSCDNCWIYCPDIAISRSNGKYTVNYDYCKGCGICVNECPRSAIHLEVRQIDGTEVK
jgi:2-oxoacid:acceptor oxidoreductase delta subunit (pyruvate/2-ketoisovalerate family)